jgi:hypothetical protein
MSSSRTSGSKTLSAVSLSTISPAGLKAGTTGIADLQVTGSADLQVTGSADLQVGRRSAISFQWLI